MSSHALRQETEAAKSLLANLRDIGADDDADIVQSSIEGETNLLEVIDAALLQAAQDQSAIKALEELAEKLDARKERLKRRVDLTKAALHAALQAIGSRKLERPMATLSVRPTPPAVVVVDEARIPSEYWKRSDPKIDKRELLKALKDGPVAGAELSNGGETLQWSFS